MGLNLGMGRDESEAWVDSLGSNKAHWETIQQWRIDEGKNFARSKGSSIARMAASGMKEGSEQWKANLASLDDANAKELKRQGGSATQGILDKWAKEMKDFYIGAAGGDYTEQINNDAQSTRTHYNQQSRALEKKGKTNVYSDSGMSEEDFRNLSTEEFVVATFGNTEKYSEYADLSGEQAAAGAKEESRKSRQRATVQQASPWWA